MRPKEGRPSPERAFLAGGSVSVDSERRGCFGGRLGEAAGESCLRAGDPILPAFGSAGESVFADAVIRSYLRGVLRVSQGRARVGWCVSHVSELLRRNLARPEVTGPFPCGGQRFEVRARTSRLEQRQTHRDACASFLSPRETSRTRKRPRSWRQSTRAYPSNVLASLRE